MPKKKHPPILARSGSSKTSKKSQKAGKKKPASDKRAATKSSETSPRTAKASSTPPAGVQVVPDGGAIPDRGGKCVVGIGASAPDSDALKAFLENTPEDTGAAFVLIQHLDPYSEGPAADLLSKHTAMQVVSAKNSTPVQPNRIYLVPPNEYVTLKEGRLFLSKSGRGPEARMPIDHFFRSLAEERREHGIGILLSGTGSDGAAGMREIKAQGGMVMVQQPVLNHGPRTEGAIFRESVDFVLPIPEMPKTLARYLKHHYVDADGRGTPIEAAPADCSSVIDLLRTHTDYDFRCYRKQTLVRRIQRRMGLRQMEQFSEYTALLKQDPDEIGLLFKDLLISVTAFFREKEAWSTLENEVVARLVSGHRPGSTIRVWVAGCATGEEAYGIAMLFLEHFEAQKKTARLQVFATDLNTDAIEFAREGIYPASIAADVPPARLKRFFTEVNGQHYQVKKHLRERMVFGVRNLIADPPFSRLNLISCRNVLIYLESEIQQKMIRLFHFSLGSGGCLFVGGSESVGREAKGFETVSRRHRIFRKNASAEHTPASFPIVSFDRAAVAQPEISETERARVDLEDMIEEPETSRGERRTARENAMSMNEELQLANEELETSREELQSMNEELSTVNAELEDKVLELEHMNNDLRNLIESTRIATIFLDIDLRIRRFTPAATDFLHVLPTDAGRPLSDLSLRFNDPDLYLDARTVLRELAPIEREIRLRTENPGTDIREDDASPDPNAEPRWFLRRILPYRTSEDKIDGVVITFTDITRLKATALRLEARERQAAEIASLGRSALIGMPLQDLFDRAVERVSKTLDAEFVKVLELLPGGGELLLRAGAGWRNGIVGNTTVPAGEASQAGYTLQTTFPVIVEDLRTERRFSGPRLLTDHAIVSGVSAVIGPPESPWGVLGAHSQRSIAFTGDDANFVQVVANVLWEAIARDRAARRLRDRERRMRLVTDAMPVLISYCDRDLVYRFCNARYREWFGLKPSDVIGRHLVDVIGESAFENVRPQLDRVLAGEHVSFDASLAYRHGSPRDVHVEYVPHLGPDDEVLGYYAMIEDVSLRLAHERGLSRLAAIVEHSNDAIIGKDLDGTVTSWNAAASRMYGYEAEEIVGQSLEKLAPPERKSEIMDVIRTLQAGRPVEHFETVRLHKSGRGLAVSLTASPIRDRKGEIVGVSTIARDITERQEWERVLREADQRKDEFLATLAHELRGPLAPIRTGLAVVRRAPDDPGKVALACRTMERQLDLLTSLVDDLLDVARITRGAIELRKRTVDVRDVIAGARSFIDESGHELRVRTPDRPVLLEADPNRLTQVFANLLHNAARYTPADGKIEVECTDEDERVVVAIRDTGVGIPEAERGRVFEMFTRSPGADELSSGLGIGLTLVKSLVELHGGQVEIVSPQWGRGAEFRISLSRGVVSTKREPGERPGDRGAVAPCRVLVADDKQDTLTMLATLVEMFGHQVRTASNGSEALEMAREFRPDVILLDLGMPDVNGYDACRRIRREPWGKDILLVALTGWGQEEDRRKTTEAGFDRHLVKPADPDELEQLLGEASDGKARVHPQQDA